MKVVSASREVHAGVTTNEAETSDERVGAEHVPRPQHPCDRVAYRVGAGATAAEGAGADAPPITIGRFAHAESPVSSVTNASPSTTDFR